MALLTIILYILLSLKTYTLTYSFIVCTVCMVYSHGRNVYCLFGLCLWILLWLYGSNMALPFNDQHIQYYDMDAHRSRCLSLSFLLKLLTIWLFKFGDLSCFYMIITSHWLGQVYISTQDLTLGGRVLMEALFPSIHLLLKLHPVSQLCPFCQKGIEGANLTG